MAGSHRASSWGTTHVPTILRSLEPRLHPGEFVFVSVQPDRASQLDAMATIVELEGTTVVLRRRDADAEFLTYDFVARWITLTAHSSLETVGLTATISAALAEAGISSNVLAGFHHDHLLVPGHQAEQAMAVLRELSREEG
ncbi:ACT domain-containing protein [Frigoribacterium sp. UYMn621]|jgi:hypothetical protein|uniref:ACT domain-containing protein n=1 Tax=Frigoribacterium sp. UYMn621 TaxID=3156343 RepID=UPI003398DCFC